MKLLINGGALQHIPSILKHTPHLIQYLGFLKTPNEGMAFDTIRRHPIDYLCMDNAAYSEFKPERYKALLKKCKASTLNPVWCTLPDIIGDAKTTLALFHEWHPRVSFPKALVGQDGAEDLDLPWSDFRCLFIGGTTEWKLSDTAAVLVKEAQSQGKLVHMGRVNTYKRLRYAYQLGCDSVDGTRYCRFSNECFLDFLHYMDYLHTQQFLF